MAQRFELPKVQVFDGNGNPYPGAKLYAYVTGTSTPKDTYIDSALATPNSNPIVADSAGRFGEIFLATGAYKFILKTSDDVTVWTADPVTRSAEASAFMDTVLDDTTAAAARATLGAGSADYPVEGVDIASSATIDLPPEQSHQYFVVTGTTSVTAIEARAAGSEVELRFADALTLTHHATNLQLPTGANITTVAGDIARFRSVDPSGQWICTKYQRQDGKALTPSASFTKEFISSDQTITLGGALTLAHSLSTTPKLAWVDLVCQTGEHGYTAGDLLVNPLIGPGQGSTSSFISIVPDATNLVVRYPNGSVTIANKTTGGNAAITVGNWKARFKAWA